MIALSATWAALTLAGILCHLVADWFFQNDWMAKNKARWLTWGPHPAGLVHAGIHAAVLLLVFPIWAALLVGIIHWLIDLRSPLEWWGKFTRQTRPLPKITVRSENTYYHNPPVVGVVEGPVVDIGMEVAFWRDQVAHFVVIALVALFV